MTIVESADGVTEASAQTLKIISFAMAMGLTAMAGLVAWTWYNSAGKVPTPENVRFINLLTTVAMMFSVVAIVASEFVWRKVVKTSQGPLSGRVQTGYIIRLAMREGAGLLGLTAGYLAAANGTLRSYPAYWVCVTPYALFLSFLAAHRPTAERLTVEAREALGS